ncbi:hypothetical protein ACGFNV_35715 [Streptomyces sp. NPDC048751]
MVDTGTTAIGGWSLVFTCPAARRSPSAGTPATRPPPAR